MLIQDRVPVEEIDTITGVGYDIEKKGENTIEYSIPISVNVFKPSGTKVNSFFKGKGQNLGEVIQKRQERMSKKFVQGHENVVLVSENYAKYGIKTLIEDRFRNAEANDMAYLVVCKGKAEDYLKYKEKGYSNASEYIAGNIEAYADCSFFSSRYKLTDSYVRLGAEGRSIVLPYIEITQDGIEIMGVAIFKEDKMLKSLDMKNSKVLNLLRNDTVKGTISLQKSPKVYIDFDAKSGRRKVKCYRQRDKYSFEIDLTLTGTVINNEMYVDIMKDINEKKQLEKDMAESIKKECDDFIKIMKNDYKVDCLELGKVAAAKYGRKKNINWNEVVSNADIKVNVNVKADLQGKGDY